MKIEKDAHVVRVSDIPEINGVNATIVREQIKAQLFEAMEAVEIDLSQTRFIDEDGLGALFAVYKAAHGVRDGVALRLLNPRPSIRQLFELTQLHQLFEVRTDSRTY